MDIKDFLNEPEIKELIAKNDLAAVYKRYAPNISTPPYNYLSEYLIDLGINPINYFKKSIPEAAFAHCTNLTSINIPDHITAIGHQAFMNCTSLKSIDIPSSVTKIGEWAFYRCDSLTDIVIPDGVKAIRAFAFERCFSLTSVTIPDSVHMIDMCAFQRCEKMTDIHYSGTKEQWSKIKKGARWRFCFATITVHCADGDILLKPFFGLQI